MKKATAVILSLILLFTMTSCRNLDDTGKPTEVPDSKTRNSETLYSETLPAQKTETTASAPNTEQKEEEPMDTNTLIVYFSCTGTTEALAIYAAEILNADIYEIIPEKPYTAADLAYYTNGRADQEQNDPDSRPAISGNVENMEQYNRIILGYPIWHGQAPRIISTFLESYDFSDKTILPFCTSHSSGIGSSADNLHPLCAESTKWAEGKRFGSGTSKEIMEEWLVENGIYP